MRWVTTVNTLQVFLVQNTLDFANKALLALGVVNLQSRETPGQVRDFALNKHKRHILDADRIWGNRSGLGKSTCVPLSIVCISWGAAV
jgi:hypothetical protein